MNSSPPSRPTVSPLRSELPRRTAAESGVYLRFHVPVSFTFLKLSSPEEHRDQFGMSLASLISCVSRSNKEAIWQTGKCRSAMAKYLLLLLLQQERYPLQQLLHRLVSLLCDQGRSRQEPETPCHPLHFGGIFRTGRSNVGVCTTFIRLTTALSRSSGIIISKSKSFQFLRSVAIGFTGMPIGVVIAPLVSVRRSSEAACQQAHETSVHSHARFPLHVWNDCLATVRCSMVPISLSSSTNGGALWCEVRMPKISPLSCGSGNASRAIPVTIPAA